MLLMVQHIVQKSPLGDWDGEIGSASGVVVADGAFPV